MNKLYAAVQSTFVTEPAPFNFKKLVRTLIWRQKNALRAQTGIPQRVFFPKRGVSE